MTGGTAARRARNRAQTVLLHPQPQFNDHMTRTRGTSLAQSWPPPARGYFAIGAERMSKALNVGNLMRSAHGFGAAFTFTVGARYSRDEAFADTSKSRNHVPHYEWGCIDDIVLPKGCDLVGVELVDDAIDLPSFRHPLKAAYVLGPEKGSLSDDMLSRCRFVVKIPTRFCVNVAMAGAIVMYDRTLSLARFSPRPVRSGGPIDTPDE